MTQPWTMGIPEVAEVLGLSESHVRRHYRKWIRENGFPAPLDITARARFKRADVERYLGQSSSLARSSADGLK